MKLSDVVSHAGLSTYAEIALVLFALAFVVVILQLVRRGGNGLQAHASIPLADDDGMRRAGEGS